MSLTISLYVIKTMRPRKIIEKLDLRRPIYAATSAYGHFGRADFPWEATDLAETLREKGARVA